MFEGWMDWGWWDDDAPSTPKQKPVAPVAPVALSAKSRPDYQKLSFYLAVAGFALSLILFVKKVK